MLKESETLELKRSTSEMKEALVSICSMLNKHHHGELYFGVCNYGMVVGQQLNEKTLRDVSKSIADGIEPKIFPTVSKIIIDGKECIHVLFSGTSQPYYANGRAYIRVGDEDRRFSAKEIENMILKKNKDKMRWDTEPCKGASIDDIDDDTLNKFISLTKDSKRIDVTTETKEMVLKKLSLVTDGQMTNAAVILFGKQPGKFFTNATVKCGRFKDEAKEEFIDMKDLNGNLFENLDKAIIFLKDHLRLSAKIEGLFRKEKWELPIEALREALINSLIHRDYFSNGFGYIKIYDSKIIIANPGRLPETIMMDDLYKEHESIQKNPLLARTFYYTGLIDAWGRGIQNIMRSLNSEGLEPPAFEESAGYFRIMFNRVNGKDWLSHNLVNRLVDNEVKVLELILKDGKATQKQMAATMGVSKVTIYNLLKNLKGMGIIRRIGNSRSGEWEVIDDARKDDGFNEDAPVNVTKGTKNDVVNDTVNDVVNEREKVGVNETENALKTVKKSALKTQKIALKNQKIALKTAQKILEQIRKNPCITIPELVTKIGIRERAIKYSLAKLKRKGLIRRIGPDRGGHWETLN